MRRGYVGVEGSIGRSYDEIEGMTMTVSGNLNMLSEITTGKELKNWIVSASPRTSTWILNSPVMMNS